MGNRAESGIIIARLGTEAARLTEWMLFIDFKCPFFWV
jgi:hypothetical protein